MASEKQRDVIPAVQDLREKGADSSSEEKDSFQHAYEQDDVTYPTGERIVLTPVVSRANLRLSRGGAGDATTRPRCCTMVCLS